MTDDGGPWGSEAPERPAPARRWGRTALWAAFLVAVGILIFALARAFPGAVRTRDDWSDVVYGLGVLLVFATALFRVSRIGIAQHLRHLAIWACVFAALALGFAYRDVLADAGRRLQLAFSPGVPVRTGARELTIAQDDHGAFMVAGRVNGQPVRFMVDTGATDTVLSPEDARRLGIDVDHLRYVDEAETANGKGLGAPYVARRLEVGPIAFDDFKVEVNKAPMSSSLLGLSFLKRLESFEVRGQTLTLRQRAGP